MRASTHIVSGCFFGATIEPGTFHGAVPAAATSPIIQPPHFPRLNGVGTSVPTEKVPPILRR